jgi:HSP20 family protein
LSGSITWAIPVCSGRWTVFFGEDLPRRWWRQWHPGWPGRLSGHPMSLFEGNTPSVDILNRESDFLIKAELPGVDKKDIAITLANNTLTLEASIGKEEKEEKAEYYRQEICRGSYRRSIALPEAVKENEAKASFRNGVLELTIPKQEKSKRSTIKVE